VLVRNRDKDARGNRTVLLPSLAGLRGELEAPVGGKPAMSGDDFVLVPLRRTRMGLSSPFSSMLRVNSPSASESMSWRSWYGLSSSCSSGISVMPASRLTFGFAWRALDSAKSKRLRTCCLKS